MEAVKIDNLTQLRDYNKRINRYVEVQLTNLMEGLTCGVSVVLEKIQDGESVLKLGRPLSAGRCSLNG